MCKQKSVPYVERKTKAVPICVLGSGTQQTILRQRVRDLYLAITIIFMHEGSPSHFPPSFCSLVCRSLKKLYILSLAISSKVHLNSLKSQVLSLTERRVLIIQHHYQKWGDGTQMNHAEAPLLGKAHWGFPPPGLFCFSVILSRCAFFNFFSGSNPGEVLRRWM